MRALIYDDDDDLAVECAEALRTRGFETRTRGDRADFVKLLGEFEPDLILLDVHMPEFNGFEALLALAEDPRKAEISIIMMSGARDNLLDAGTSLCGAHDIPLLGTLPKPFGLPDLDKLLSRRGGALR
ncbi:MAG: response regulator [Parvibaculum sp.]|uniref:response regulator n=1 Tax=Parvibaculum sp. TaxID=2024848 RepID=UPI002ABA6BAA|nr:response regulator [Parvibaculum sp.]MDZ4380984.1 response regulator [Parvibaculum sp.]